MKYNLSENLSERKGVVSNLHGFLNRYLDGGFKTKWSGYWAPPIKYLDYFSFKINGIWLDKETLNGIEYGEKIIYYHETGSLSVEEHISAPDQFPGLKVELKLRNKEKDRKAVHAVLETGVDIRDKSEDISSSDYSLERNNERLNISSQSKNLVIKSDKAFDLRGEPYTKEHYPGEKQKCFIPGDISFREEVPPETKESVEIEFLTSNGSFKEIDSRSQELRNRDLGRTFNYSIESMENLIYDREGPGLVAGHPWFQEYWARDSFWTLLGLIDAGYFEISREILENFADKDLKSKIELEDGSSDGKNREDTAPLFIIAADKLRRHHEISGKIEEGIEQALKSLETEEGVIKHPENATWMDTLDRSPAVDIQSLWLEALGLENDKKSERVAEGLEEFKDDSYMKDHLGEDVPETINPAVPLMFGHVGEKDAEKYLEKINGEFSSNHGARTRSVTDPGYEADGYHRGSVWGLTTMWAAAANLKYGRDVEGKNYLEKMTQYIDRNQPGALPEVVNAENGELIGCSEQAWSAGLYVHVVDTYLLGIDVRDEKVIIDPASGFSGKRFGKRVGDEVLDIKVDEGKIELLNEPDIEVELKGEQ